MCVCVCVCVYVCVYVCVWERKSMKMVMIWKREKKKDHDENNDYDDKED
jgi:hypothetical protein